MADNKLALASDEIETEPDEVEDKADSVIDPAAWLSGTDGADKITGYYELPNGQKLRLAALTDSEEAMVRNASGKVNPRNVKGPRLLSQQAYRRNVIATSINKAYGYKLGDPKYVTPESMASRPAGELTQIMDKVFQVSGFKSQSDDNDTSSEAIDLFE